MVAREHLLAPRLALFYAAYFAAVGIHLPFWPVWLEWRGLGATEIGYVLAAAFWPRVATSLLIPALSDRLGERRRPMILLTAVTLAGLILFGLTRDFWPLLLLSLLTGASWAAILPLGEVVALGEAKRRELNYGRIRLWGSLAFILAAIGVGEWLEYAGPSIVLWSIAATVACLLVACLLLPAGRSGEPPAAAADFRRLVGNPGFLAFVAAAGLIQVSHAVYYGFATLHWRAAGHGELVIGLLWAEGVVAEIVLFAFAAALLRWCDPVRLLILAGALTVARWALTALSTDLAVLVPAQALHAASFGVVHLAAMHYLRDRTPAELHASAQGFYAAIGTALPFGLVTPVGGWLYGVTGGGAFWAMAAIALAGTALAATGRGSSDAPPRAPSRHKNPADSERAHRCTDHQRLDTGQRVDQVEWSRP
jgi:MFS transporter, PPP family, 3-phenylpropionic acid transporter